MSEKYYFDNLDNNSINYYNNRIQKLENDIKLLSDRLIERTKAYEEKDSRQVRQIQQLKNELHAVRVCFAQASHNDCQAGPEIESLKRQIKELTSSKNNV